MYYSILTSPQYNTLTREEKLHKLLNLLKYYFPLLPKMSF